MDDNGGTLNRWGPPWGGFREERVLEGVCSKGEPQNEPQVQGKRGQLGLGGHGSGECVVGGPHRLG